MSYSPTSLRPSTLITSPCPPPRAPTKVHAAQIAARGHSPAPTSASALTSLTDLVQYATFDRISTPPTWASRYLSERALFMPHHYQVNSHWFTFATHYSPLARHPLAMRTRYNPHDTSAIAGRHSRTWHWSRATLANFGVAQKLEPKTLAMLQVVADKAAVVGVRDCARRFGWRNRMV